MYLFYYYFLHFKLPIVQEINTVQNIHFNPKLCYAKSETYIVEYV